MNTRTIFGRSVVLLRLLCFVAAGESSAHSTVPELPTKEDLLVVGLDKIVPEFGLFEGTMYAGRLPMQNGNRSGELMFWLFAPDHPASTNSIQLWLNGGPGCTSFSAGLLFEHSPVTIPPRPPGYCCIQDDEPLQYNKYAWTNATTMLYLEQPVGVGFSTGGPPPENEDDIARDVYSFLVNFYKVFPEYLPYDFFVFGESYAGMYAPSVARRVYLETLEYRKGKTSNRANVTVGGLALGNGWVDARVQGPATIDYAYWHGMIDSTTRDALWARWGHCFHSKGGNEPEPFHEFNTPDDCAMSEGALMAAGATIWPTHIKGPNQYDVTTWDPYITLFPGNTTIQNFYNNKHVKRVLHAPEDVQWYGCIPGAGRRRLVADLLAHDEPVSTLPYIAELLDGGVPVLIYNGDRDLSTCAQGSEMLLDSMEWKGQDGWPSAPRGLWTVNDDKQVAGYTKEHENLYFVVVYNSGHLVPFNQPLAALDLVNRFIQGKSFADYKLPSFTFTDQERYFAKTGRTSSNMARHVSSHHRSGWHWLSMILVMVASFAGGYIASFVYRKKSGYEVIRNSEEELARNVHTHAM